MWVKICGTTSLEDAELAVGAGADALGFIFAPSKRRVSMDEVVGITPQLPPTVETVGVFTEAHADQIIPTLHATGLSAVQLHMHYRPERTAKLRESLAGAAKLIQVIPFFTGAIDSEVIFESFEKPLTAAMADPALWAVLLDTAKDGRSGGLGETFSWQRALPAVRRAQAAALALRRGSSFAGGPDSPKLLLAGGLDAGNVAEAIAVLEPWGVDCVSGVEASPGRKDPDRLAAFLSAARTGR